MRKRDDVLTNFQGPNSATDERGTVAALQRLW